MLIAPNTTSLSIDVQIVDDAGLPVTGLVAASFPAVYWSLNNNTAATAIALSDLATIATAWTSGGVKERVAGGYYRLDLPNAALANIGEVSLIGEAGGKHLLAAKIVIGGQIDPQMLLRQRNTAQAGTSGSITLDAAASNLNDFYVGGRVITVAGAGAGQDAIITAYNGTTKIATITPPWIGVPDNTTQFVIAGAAADVVAWRSAKVNAAIAGYPQVDLRYWNSDLIDDADPPTAAEIEAYFAALHGAGQWGGQTIQGVAAASPIAALDADFIVGTGAYWRQTVSATGLDSTSWKSFVLTIKRSAEKDEDQAALLVIRISNPAAAGDGLLVLRGIAATDPTLASLQVNSVSPDTSVTWTIAAAAMDINPSPLEPYSWELTRFT